MGKEYIKHPVTQKAERETSRPAHRKAILKGKGYLKKCAATAPDELPVICWGKKKHPTPGEEGSLERRCSNSQVREALASKGRSARSSCGVTSDPVTHKAFPFRAGACVPTHGFGRRAVPPASPLCRVSHVSSSGRLEMCSSLEMSCPSLGF